MSWCWLWLRVVAVVGWRADEGEHLSFEGGFAGFLLLFGETGDVGPFGHSSGLLVRSEAGFVPEMGFQKAKESVDGLDGVTAGFLVGLELEESTILHFEEEVIERAEAVGTFVETGMAAFDGLLDHGTVNNKQTAHLQRILVLSNARCRRRHIQPIRVRRHARNTIVHFIMLSADTDHPEIILI